MKFEAVNDHMSTTRVKGSMFEDKDPDMKETLYEQLQSIGFRAATLQRCLETAMLKLAKKFLFSHHRQTRTRHPTLTVRGRQHSRQPPCSVEHLATWKLPGGITGNQIDHILIGRLNFMNGGRANVGALTATPTIT